MVCRWRKPAFLNQLEQPCCGGARSELGDEKIDHASAPQLGYYIPNTIVLRTTRATPMPTISASGDQSNSERHLWHHADRGDCWITTDIDEDGWDPNATAKYVGRIADRNFYARERRRHSTRTRAISMWGSTSTTSWIHLQRWRRIQQRIRRFLSVRAEKFFKPNFAVGGRHVRTRDDDTATGSAPTVSWRF